MCGMLRFTPTQVRAMSLAEAFLCIEGFTEMQNAQAGVRPNEFPTKQEVDDLFAQIAEIEDAKAVAH